MTNVMMPQVRAILPVLTILYACAPAGMGNYAWEPRDVELRDQVYDRQAEFDRLDADGDGYLTSAEYNGTEQLFVELDDDDDGFMSPDEARYMMTFADIPGGSFTMGTDEPIQAFQEPATDASPAHKVRVDAFQMAATEITTTQYALYLNSALEAGEITVSLGDVSDEYNTRVGYPVPAYVVEGAEGKAFAGEIFIHLSPITALTHVLDEGSGLLIPGHPLNQGWINYSAELEYFSVYPGFEDWPAAFLKWWGAQAFAEHYGLSLPTEAEWEYAARGGEQYDFPTSDGTNDCSRSNHACYNVMDVPKWDGADTPEEFINFRFTVGSWDPNPYGLFDMAGNVWEWNLDWYHEDFYQHAVDQGITTNPVNLDGEDPPMDGTATGGPGQLFSHDARVCRGGSYNYHEQVTRTAYRFPVYPFIGNDHFGARVVLRPASTVLDSGE